MLAHPQRILLVDDEEAFGYAAAKVLRKAGFEVSLAPDHRLALQILETPQPLDLPTAEAIGKILRKPIPLDVLVQEAGIALAADGDPSPERL
jgi:CheY-like chemotaxis protein